MVILSSPSGVGRQLSKKIQQNTNLLKSQFLILQDHPGQMKLMA